ncbi:MAG: hypothetical protein JW913_19770 [Chitinispirillaceae bacterium]|nr:hypothetical protein [Chitinispirillaceae bacterium]
MGNNIIALLIAGVFCAACVNDCAAADRAFKGKITDRKGKPVAEAVVYIEAHREGKGAFDFVYAIVDSASKGAFSLNIKWKRNALMAYAVFAPDMHTIAGFDWIRYYKTHDLLFDLDSIAHDGKDCETRLVGMSFPFERIPSLADRVRQAENRQLLLAFIDAYKSIIEGACPVPSGNEEKIRAMKELQSATSPQ